MTNLNSVESQKLRKGGLFASYKYINFVLDEVELYYHPEWQRRYVKDLIDYIERINPKNLSHIKGINIMILTHSPYILSDIPKANTLRLENGDCYNKKDFTETFGANIHTLLANDFFMHNGFMGEMAKKKIEEVILKLNFLILRNKYKEIDIQNTKDEMDIETEQGKTVAEVKVLFRKILEIEKNNNMSIDSWYEYKVNGKELESIIQIVGEPIIKGKLISMYLKAYSIDNQVYTKKKILAMAREANLSVNFNDLKE